MREAGDVCFADVYKDGVGVCEYVRYEDMKYALKKLDDTKFKSHEVCNLLMQEIHFRFYESISIIPYIFLNILLQEAKESFASPN